MRHEFECRFPKVSEIKGFYVKLKYLRIQSENSFHVQHFSFKDRMVERSLVWNFIFSLLKRNKPALFSFFFQKHEIRT
jgi:hypothetical protein